MIGILASAATAARGRSFSTLCLTSLRLSLPCSNPRDRCEQIAEGGLKHFGVACVSSHCMHLEELFCAGR
jgi:hypothetical protein